MHSFLLIHTSTCDLLLYFLIIIFFHSDISLNESITYICIFTYSFKKTFPSCHIFDIFSDRNKNKLTKKWNNIASINCCSLMRTQRNNKMKWTKGLRFAICFIWLKLVFWRLFRSVLFILRRSTLVVPWVYAVFFSSTCRAKAQKANTHLNKNELLVHKEKLRFNRWPLVHFIQLALISHCSRYPNIIFMSFSAALIRATCFVTFTKHSNIKTVFFVNRFSVLHLSLYLCEIWSTFGDTIIH